MTRDSTIPETVTLHVPFRLVKRGGRKEMQLPAGASHPHKTDNTLVKALARAFRWKRMLESGEFATIGELAENERIAFTYMARVLRLTLLTPHVVEAIVEGRHGRDVTLARVLAPFPIEWDRQLKMGWARPHADELHRRATPTSAKKEGKNPNERSSRRT